MSLSSDNDADEAPPVKNDDLDALKSFRSGILSPKQMHTVKMHFPGADSFRSPDQANSLSKDEKSEE